MVVSYQNEVATYKHGRFIKLLMRWKASVFKLVWMDVAVLLVCYYALSFIYLFALNASQKLVFESLVAYCQIVNSLVPLSFVLGFFVSQIVMRWWKQCTSLPWPDPVAVFVSTLIRGENDSGRMVRRTIMRYVNLTITLTLRQISPSVKKRFATYDRLVEIGLLTETELKMFNYWDQALTKVSNYWVPIVWVSNILVRAQKEGMIQDENGVQSLLLCVNNTRTECLRLLQYDFMNIPLVYTQTVTLAFYAYFVGAVVGHQWTENMQFSPFPVQKYFPVLLLLQFLFYMGWIKVAEVMIAPFGEDDDDLELNWVIDRNITVSYAIVDEMHQRHPELMKDAYWDTIYPEELPYRGVKKDEMPVPSTFHVEEHGNKQLLTIFKRNEKGLISPISSEALSLFEFTKTSKEEARLDEDSSELSLASMMRKQQATTDLPKMLHEDDEERLPPSLEGFYEEGGEEGFSEEVSEEDDDLFERLKEERERLRLERTSIKYVPIKVSKVPSKLKRSQLTSPGNISAIISHQSVIMEEPSTLSNDDARDSDSDSPEDYDDSKKKKKKKKKTKKKAKGKDKEKLDENQKNK